MISFLNDKFKKDGKKKFLSQAALLCLISDIINIGYLNFYFFQKKITTTFLINAGAIQGLNLSSLPRQDLLAYRHLLISTLANVFLGFLVYHAIVYFKLAKDKKWAKKYVYGYVITGGVLTLIEIPSLLSDHLFWGLCMIVTASIYAYTFLGIKFFKKQEE